VNCKFSINVPGATGSGAWKQGGLADGKQPSRKSMIEKRLEELLKLNWSATKGDLLHEDFRRCGGGF
jgi:hypothetical protein